ncbi:tetratricopeptide repeat-containing sensor histidine kinase [Gaetbulibacter saemankumensis]|uniref:tetratricopeptide repeat-containing sensor histidine kinase n=1 Tax=Gaetbulibacter saemankumensis TaxID=311208 RepID=UPI000419F201|nr:sensor histidine kinase [Gaetbulibacter saemankumensis]
MKYKFWFLLCLLTALSHSQKSLGPIVDSIEYYINTSSSKKLDKYIRLKQANRAKILAENYQLDSLIVDANVNLAAIYNNQEDYNLFLFYSHEAYKLAKRLKDTTSLALVNKNLGYYYYDKIPDSAYYYNDKAEKLYRHLNDNLNRAIVLLDIALLQKQEKDLTGSELTSVEALSLLDKLDPNNDTVKAYQIYLYNNLGQVFKILEQHDEEIIYFERALDGQLALNADNMGMVNNLQNNLAVAYKDAGKYNLAIKLLEEILADKNLLKTRPDFYAVVLDNYAHALQLADNTEQLPNLYHRSLKICDSIDNDVYTIITKQHLAKYYQKYGNMDSAKYYAYQAKTISEKYSKDDLLRSLLLLSELESDSVAVKYYDAYIKLSDSLLKNERATRNKYARIHYETEQIERENRQIAKERLWLLIISVVLIIASILLYLVITQRNKNKELKLIQQQQQANEEIYNLMLSQNERIEEARVLEKKRISEELHDGVLGRLFGTRLSLDSLNMNNSPEAIKTRSEYIDGLKTIENDIRKVSHELNTDFVSGSGFIDIIKTLVETQTLAYEIDYHLDYEEIINWDDVNNKMKIHIYRIIQETLHNIYKHANATRVDISFKLKNNVICLAISDDGTGFDVNKAKSGIGIKNMNSRIKDINGTLSIVSSKNEGTTLTIEAPIA